MMLVLLARPRRRQRPKRRRQRPQSTLKRPNGTNTGRESKKKKTNKRKIQHPSSLIFKRLPPQQRPCQRKRQKPVSRSTASANQSPPCRHRRKFRHRRRPRGGPRHRGGCPRRRCREDCRKFRMCRVLSGRAPWRSRGNAIGRLGRGAALPTGVRSVGVNACITSDYYHTWTYVL